MSEDWYMKRPCAHCPFRRDVRPFLHPERAEQIAYSAQNPHSDFSCHKTIEHDDDGEGYETEQSKTCAGFLAMQINDGGMDEPEGWEWSGDVHCDAGEMVDAYEAAWEAVR